MQVVNVKSDLSEQRAIGSKLVHQFPPDCIKLLEGSIKGSKRTLCSTFYAHKSEDSKFTVCHQQFGNSFLYRLPLE